MKLIKRDTDYALRALCIIACCGKKIASVKQLCVNSRIPRPFLRKILQKLNKSGILTSYKGKGGGFLLSRKADKISVLDIIKIFQGPVALNDHIFKKKKCPKIYKCFLKKKIDAVEKRFIEGLDSISISSIT